MSALPVSHVGIIYPFPHLYGDSGRASSGDRDVSLVGEDERNEGVEKSNPGKTLERREPDHDRALEHEESECEQGMECSNDDKEGDSSTDGDDGSDDNDRESDDSGDDSDDVNRESDVDSGDSDNVNRESDDRTDPGSSHFEEGQDEACADTLLQIATHADEVDIAPVDILHHDIVSSEAFPPRSSTSEPMLVSDAYPLSVVNMPLQGEIATLNAKAVVVDSVSFHGFIVPPHLLEPLEWLYSLEREFWADCIVSGTDVVGSMINLLGRAIEPLSRPWSSLSVAELELLVKAVAGAHGLNFRIGSLERIVSKAKKLLSCQDAVKRVTQLKAELKEAELNLERLLGDEDISCVAATDAIS